jgi:hypothetical protein
MKRTLFFVIGTTLLTSSAFANPFATEVLRARAVAGPHVQLTYGMDSGYKPLSSVPDRPSQVSTYGTVKTP